jgi:hypothetical protein
LVHLNDLYASKATSQNYTNLSADTPEINALKLHALKVNIWIVNVLTYYGTLWYWIMTQRQGVKPGAPAGLNRPRSFLEDRALKERQCEPCPGDVLPKRSAALVTGKRQQCNGRSATGSRRKNG